MATLIIGLVALAFIVWLGLVILLKSGLLETQTGRFNRLAREYNLQLSITPFPYTFLLRPDQRYTCKTLTGSIHSHTVVIEDIFSLTPRHSSPCWYGFAKTMDNMFPKGGQFLDTYTDLSVDGSKRTLNQILIPPEPFNTAILSSVDKIVLPVSYADIKTQLDQLN